ncbi:MAG: hypothetical protein ACW98K_16910 [Candidatus Kariarchaeaceae archaeon]|jgi:hypothetical protein
MTDENSSLKDMTEKEFVAHLKQLQKSGKIDTLEFLRRFSEWKTNRKETLIDR